MSETTDHEKEPRTGAEEVTEREERRDEPQVTGTLYSDGGGTAPDEGGSGDPIHGGGEDQEAEVLRSELIRLQEELHEANARADEMKDRFMRARAELENFRRRATAEAERARESGLDSVVLPVLSVYDDLRRALEAADTADPAAIVPGVQSVLSGLERNLDSLGIKAIGNVGETFDPDLHEALTSIATSEAEKSETIAEVFQLGFQKGERLIRPARVVVYQS